MSQSQRTGSELFQYLKENFTNGSLIQYRLADIEQDFTGKELEALTQLFGHYQVGMGTDSRMPTAIHASEKEDAITYLDRYLGN
jgi:hypothetical protein